MRIPVSGSPYARYTPAKPAAETPRPIETANDLRQVLSAEEERFFTESASTGPLWYRRDGGAGNPPAPRLGQRLDIRA
jgi:hypothetical protein